MSSVSSVPAEKLRNSAEESAKLSSDLWDGDRIIRREGKSGLHNMDVNFCGRVHFCLRISGGNL